MTVADVEVTTEVDLESGERRYSAALSPVPVETPAGFAPGTITVTAGPGGGILGVALEVRPHPAVFRGAAVKLAAACDWPVEVDALRYLPAGQQPVVRLELSQPAVSRIGKRISEAAEFAALLEDPAVLDPSAYRVAEISAEG